MSQDEMETSELLYSRLLSQQEDLNDVIFELSQLERVEQTSVDERFESVMGECVI